ncbi:TIGR00725 family protein [Kitasatospora sp. NPDC056138]|uniref:TIGR00725 family protein n=1 Tax=Kitasatospora sp. NPDC056138 TaxID=3345724 RepID=UPI0035DB3360
MSAAAPVPPFRPYVAVVGPADATREESATARRVGALLAAHGAVVVCGGLGGVMEAACEGARHAGGTTVGLLPGADRDAGNAFLSVAVATALGELRNGLIVSTSDAVIAVGGSWGTLSEVALALRAGKPTVVVHGWEVLGPRAGDGPLRTPSPDLAVDVVLGAVRSRPQ